MATSDHTETFRSSIGPYVLLMRPRQWAKSVFVLAPLFFSGQLTDAASVVSSLVAAIVFALASSGVYVLNDLADVEADRRHPVKKLRPLASGKVSRQGAIVLLAMVLGFAAVISLGYGLPAEVNVVLLVYLIMNVAYSAGFREIPLLDISLIATSFVLRVLAGAFAIDVQASSWIILATGLLALLMAFGKRRVDLHLESVENRNSLHGYTIEFSDVSVGVRAAALVAF